MPLKDELSKDEATILQWVMQNEPVSWRQVDPLPGNLLNAVKSLCLRGLLAYVKDGWRVNWPHIPRRDDPHPFSL